MAEAPNAVRELADDATSRKRFLRQAGGGGVAASLAVFIAACGGDSKSSSKAAATSTPTMSAKSGTEQFGKGDLGIANYALTLEYLETDFYAKVSNSGMLKGKVADLAKRFGNEEQAHVDALIATDQEGRRQAGRRAEDDLPARRREVDPEARRDRREPRRPRLPRPGRATSRTRRSWPPPCRSTRSRRGTPSVLNLATGAKPAPDAFAKPVTADEVLKTVKPFLAT